MPRKRLHSWPVALFVIVTGLMTIISIGGCPVAQQPTTPVDQQDDQTQETRPPNNQNQLNRPIPPPPLDEGDGQDGSGGSSGGVPGADGGDDGGGDSEQSQPLVLNITAPGSANIYLQPGGEGTVTYEVFGGDPNDGPITVELFYDLDGVAATGDEATLKTNLPPRGTEGFTALGVDTGSYHLGLRAANNKASVAAYADGQLVVVGEPVITFVKPVAGVEIRPGAGVPVQFNIATLATSVTYTVFIDTDTEVNGNETDAFGGGGLNPTGTIVTAALTTGTYFIGVTVSDSVGHKNTVYFRNSADALVTFTIDEAPTVVVTEPLQNVIVDPGTPVQVTVNVADPEGSADVVLFYDADGAFNGNEGTITTRQLTNPQATFNADLITDALEPGVYRVGASIDDGVDKPVAAYALGTVRVTGPPSVVITIPTPTTSMSLRPGKLVDVKFTIDDPERVLLDDGVRVILAQDANVDGVLDQNEQANPVWQSTETFGEGPHSYKLDTAVLNGLIDPNLQYGLFVVGIRAEELSGQAAIKYATDAAKDTVFIYADSNAPQFVDFTPVGNLIREYIDTLTINITTNDTSPILLWVYLDSDINPPDPLNFPGMIDEIPLVEAMLVQPGQQVTALNLNLEQIKEDYGAGKYYYFVYYMDGVLPAFSRYAAPPGANQSKADELYSLTIRDRIIDAFDVTELETRDDAAVLRGINAQDLAGSALKGVPDLNDDGKDEVLITSRFGKPYKIDLGDGVGFGEGYLIYGDRLTGAQTLSAVGGLLDGMVFNGIRAAQTNAGFGLPNLPATEGLADVTVVDDMDGDGLPEIVFSFPRVESVSLATTSPLVQSSKLFPDLSGLGNLEYSAWDPQNMVWTPNVAQFTRGGIVVVSSHNLNLQNEDLLNRKGNRVIDLHEAGQVFTSMSRPGLVVYTRPLGGSADTHWLSNGVADCDGDTEPETDYVEYEVRWDTVFDNQGPGGFQQTYTDVPQNPPLAQVAAFTEQIPAVDSDGCAPIEGCKTVNKWYTWPGPPPFPGTVLGAPDAWDGGGFVIWTGYYRPSAQPRDYTIGARVLGQDVKDRFGTSVTFDGTWLYIAAPERTARDEDVLDLAGEGDRFQSGVVYQLRVNIGQAQGGRLRKLQLWQERERSWPDVDQEDTQRSDYTMPVPHQYIIETVGSIRGYDKVAVPVNPSDPWVMDHSFDNGDCPPPYAAQGGARQTQTYGYTPYASSTAGYWIDQTWQIVGPHQFAKIDFVQAVDDINDDGYNDYVIGCQLARSDFADAGSDTVGGLFLVFSEEPGKTGDVLLDKLAVSPADPNRLNGVWIKGREPSGDAQTPAEFGRTVDGAGDFDGDGVADLIIGDSAHAQAIVVLGSRTLQSPEVGYEVEDDADPSNGMPIETDRVVRFRSSDPTDETGFSVASAGDVDGDGNADVLIAAPLAEGGKGKVYLIYGSPDLVGGVFDLANAGTLALPGIVFTGRGAGDALGGGFSKAKNLYHKQGVQFRGQGLTKLGDIDNDGHNDFAFSAIGADPLGKTDAGEVYIFYGSGD
ncbi:MAG: integrin alpha [Planctomycetes bacterium]|nr:integrin alpha [Planctomycetota bacterium]